LTGEIDAHPKITRIVEAISELDQQENRRRYRVALEKYCTVEERLDAAIRARYEWERKELTQKIENMFKKPGAA
jgi:uncharacterized OsmC-like protein